SIGTASQGGLQVGDKKRRIAIQEAHSTAVRPCRRSEDTEQQTTQDASYPVYAKRIERIIVSILALEHHAAEACRAAQNSNRQGAHRRNKAGARRDHHEARYHTGRSTKCRRLSMIGILN